MTAQDVNIVILDGGLGVLPPASAPLPCLIGPSSAGPIATPFVSSRASDIIAAFGEGPTVQSAIFMVAQTGAPVMVVRSTTGTPGTSDTLVFTGTGTSVVTHSGAPLDGYGVIFTVVTGGTIGVAGITFKYSLDNGVTYSAVKPLGVASTASLLTGSGASSGMSLAFAAGTLVAGDQATFGNTGPVSTASDVAIAMQSVLDSTYQIDHWHVCQPTNATDAVTYALKTTAAEAAYRYMWGLYESRDQNSGEAAGTWEAAIVSDFSGFSDLRSSVAAGYYLTTSAIDGNQIRRSVAWPASVRAIKSKQSQELGAVADGALAGISAPSDGNFYYDARVNPILDTNRFMVVRSLIGKPGLFIKNSNIMAPPGSDFDLIPNRRVMDVACATAHATLLETLNASVRIDPTTGFILEKDRIAIQNHLNQALVDTLISTGLASSVAVVVAGNDNILSTRTLTVSIRIVPLGYVKSINVTIGFTNPALSIAA